MKLLRRVVPAPLTSAALFALWLVLARAPGVGQVALGLALALVTPLLTAGLRPTKVRVRRPLVVICSFATVVWPVSLASTPRSPLRGPFTPRIRLVGRLP